MRLISITLDVSHRDMSKFVSFPQDWNISLIVVTLEVFHSDNPNTPVKLLVLAVPSGQANIQLIFVTLEVSHPNRFNSVIERQS